MGVRRRSRRCGHIPDVKRGDHGAAPTLDRVHFEPANVDRGVYETLGLRFARQPSETVHPVHGGMSTAVH